MSSFVHRSPTTIVTFAGGKIHKKFIGENPQERFEKEISFLKNYKSEYLPHLVDYNSESLELVFTTLRGEYPGFLDNTEASLLSLNDFQRIRNALFEIQNLHEKIIVHADLAPHNVYLTKDRVVIADWDSYFHTEDSRYKLYDYATLWSLLDTNEDGLTEIFTQEYEQLQKEDLASDFEYCYIKRVEFLQKYPKQFEQGTKLRESIISKISSHSL